MLDKSGNRIVLVFKVGTRLLCILFIGVFLHSIKLHQKDIGYLFDAYFYVPTSPVSFVKKELGPKRLNKLPPPEVTAQGVLIKDTRSDLILFEKNKDQVFPPASTTKLMTALVSLDLYAQTDKFTIDLGCTQVPSQRAGFYPGEVFTVKDLVYSLLISSAGDSACTLSNHIPAAVFVDKMNAKADKLGMKHSKFSNAIGLDDFENGQISTPTDLAVLAKASIENKLISDIVRNQTYIVNSLESSTSIPITHTLINTNKLLGEIPNTVGLKTGKTDGAGEVLIYAYEKDKVKLIIVTMKSDDRFGDTKKLLEWVLAEYSWTT